MTHVVDRSGTAVGAEGIPFADRLQALRRVRRFLTDHPRAVHELLCEISTHRAAGYEIEAAVATLDGALGEMERHRPPRVPRLAVFMPSNVMLYSYVLYLLVPALYTEHVVFRPSSQVKDQMVRLHALLAEHHRLPVELSTASQRGFMRDHVEPAEAVVFTGTYANAEQIRARLRPEQLFLFLGSGVNPFVVAPRRRPRPRRPRRRGDPHAQLRPGLPRPRPVLRPRGPARRVRRRPRHRTEGPALRPLRRPPRRLRADLLRRRPGGSRPLPRPQPGPHRPRRRRRLPHPAHRTGRRRRRGGHPRTQVPEFFAPVFNVVGYHDEDDLAATLTTGVFTERALGSSVYGTAPRLTAALRRRTTVTVDTTLLSIDDGNAPFGGYGRQANYISVAGELRAEPVLVSKAVAEHFPKAAR
ncbi:hypothetical protein GCM10020256_15610 [Streptomyces thermocoprophilus]